MRQALVIAVLAIMLATFLAQTSDASYTVTYLNTTVYLNANTSARVVEILNLSISNSSISQYRTDRLALNLTLSTWQSLVGPELVEHIINPKSGVYKFEFLPGPLMVDYNGAHTYLMMNYYVKNVTSVTETGPRLFKYTFNPDVFNFEHAASGQVLPQNTSFTIVFPNTSTISSVYPIPDYPAKGFTSGYSNVTKISWNNGEPLSKFTLTFYTHESLQEEVINFFKGIYGALGMFTYVIIAAVILVLIMYTYLKVAG
ncbi:MAG: hypothetical protein UNLARM2_0181 [Candidatus Micrarchaeum acidiphilum ARMAN-2]|jgi:hypothetical protein|uniref:Uncharacterized protein n=1 Tax=Candidatus Micrarchaeum acidiphilum ARMAN-2 TaxID=425595 RepID=C7DGH9_MICA2|nr:MAG: hypothetical protein UNLARM2_0181 [Candidatus Micrarchaeum acidiphilum ARMAN-2]